MLQYSDTCLIIMIICNAASAQLRGTIAFLCNNETKESNNEMHDSLPLKRCHSWSRWTCFPPPLDHLLLLLCHSQALAVWWHFPRLSSATRDDELADGNRGDFWRTNEGQGKRRRQGGTRTASVREDRSILAGVVRPRNGWWSHPPPSALMSWRKTASVNFLTCRSDRYWWQRPDPASEKSRMLTNPNEEPQNQRTVAFRQRHVTLLCADKIAIAVHVWLVSHAPA